jgi:hypothetical protein
MLLVISGTPGKILLTILHKTSSVIGGIGHVRKKKIQLDINKLSMKSPLLVLLIGMVS